MIEVISYMETGSCFGQVPDVVVNLAIGPLAPFHTDATDGNVVVDFVVRGSVVEVQAPTGFFIKEIVADNYRLHRIHQDLPRIKAAVGGIRAVGLRKTPGAISTPGIERAMVAGLANRVVGLIELNDMSTPGTVANTDSRPRHVVDQVVANRNPLRP